MLVDNGYDLDIVSGTGLFEELVESGILSPDYGNPGVGWETPRRSPLHYLSAPRQWCFSQVRDAALLILEIQERAMRRGLSLRTVSIDGIRHSARGPVLVRALDLERNASGAWPAYRQFCRQFLGPLLLMSHRWPKFTWYGWNGADGVSLPTASRLLGWRSYFDPDALRHVHLPERLSKVREQDRQELVRELRTAVNRINPPRLVSQPSPNVLPVDEPARFRRTFLRSLLSSHGPRMVCDVSGPGGRAARLAGEVPMLVVDGDPTYIESLYRWSRSNGRVPLFPCLGTLDDLRLQPRGLPAAAAEMVLVMDRLHDLRLREQYSFEMLAGALSRLAGRAVVEYIPPEDPAAMMLEGRGRRMPEDYRFDCFLAAFLKRFALVQIEDVPGTMRRVAVFGPRDGAKLRGRQTAGAAV